MTPVFYTIGHSTRTLEELAALLRVGGVERIVDVRAMPRSRANPQFNGDVLPEALGPFDIAYSAPSPRRRLKDYPGHEHVWNVGTKEAMRPIPAFRDGKARAEAAVTGRARAG